MKRAHLLVAAIEDDIRHWLAKHDGPVGLAIDGWTENATHFCGVFLLTEGSEKQPLLGFAPLPDEESMSAISHIKYLDFLMDVYDIRCDCPLSA